MEISLVLHWRLVRATARDVRVCFGLKRRQIDYDLLLHVLSFLSCLDNIQNGSPFRLPPTNNGHNSKEILRQPTQAEPARPASHLGVFRHARNQDTFKRQAKFLNEIETAYEIILQVAIK